MQRLVVRLTMQGTELRLALYYGFSLYAQKHKEQQDRIEKSSGEIG